MAASWSLARALRSAEIELTSQEPEQGSFRLAASSSDRSQDVFATTSSNPYGTEYRVEYISRASAHVRAELIAQRRT